MYVLVPKYKISLFTYGCIRIQTGSPYTNSFYVFPFTYGDVFMHPYAYRFLRPGIFKVYLGADAFSGLKGIKLHGHTYYITLTHFKHIHAAY